MAVNDHPAAADQPTGAVTAQVVGDVRTSDETASLWGRVMRANGSPAGNVIVSVSDQDGVHTATTSPEGYYNFDGLVPGAHTATVYGASVVAIVGAKHRAIVNFTLP